MSTSGGSAINFNRTAPVVDYTSLDAESFKADVIVYAQATYSDRWTDFNPTQFAVVFLDVLSYFFDMLTFTINAGLREVTTPTVQRRSHMLVLAEMLDYTMRSASPATANLMVTSNPLALPYSMPAATTMFSAGSVVFQPDADYTITTTPQTIGVIEGQRYTTVALGTSAGTANQQFVIPNAPVIDGTISVYVSAAPWSALRTLSGSSPGDTVYVLSVDDEGNVTVIFGDGVNGKIPPTSSPITASYTVGGGVQGRVGPDTIKSIISAPAGVLSVTNAARAVGGSDQETIEQARSAVPASLSAGDRCVTLTDYATVALAASSSVAKAAAFQEDARTVRVVVAPAGGGAPSDGLKNAVGAYLSSRKTIGHRVKMSDPYYVQVLVNVDLFVTPSAKAGDIAIAARGLFVTASATDQQNGIVDFDNAGFGARNDQGDPQLTQSLVDRTLDKLGPRGMQTSRINVLTTVPFLKPASFVSSTDASLVWTPTAGESDELTRRRWRIKFTSPTAYTVYEGIDGKSTQLTRSQLTDDRALFPSIASVTATLNPNTDQSAVLALNEAACTAQTMVLQTSTDDLYAYAVPGDSYRVEWGATPSTGTVGVLYTPTKLDGDPHGFSWIVAGSGFSAGDQYTIDVFSIVDDILLDVDEIPVLDASNLVVNVRNAY